MTRAVHRCLSFALAALLAAPAGAAEPAAADVITLEKIMSDPDWIGSLPENPAWADDGRSVFFERKRQGETVRDLYQLSIEGGEARLVEDAERGSKAYGEGDWSDDRTRKVFSRGGDVFVHDLGRGSLTALTRTNEEESGAFFLVGDRQVGFRRGDGWFVRDLDSGVEWQAADLRAAKDPAEQEVEKSFLEEQEERLFDVLREGERRAKTSRRVEEERQRKDPLRPRLPWYLGDEIEIQDSLLSPTGDFLMVVFGDEGDDSKQDQMPQWVTKSALVETIKLRPHVGAQVVKSPRVALLDLRNHQRHDLDLTTLPGITDDPLAELRKAAERARKEREQKREAEAKLERGAKAAVEPPAAASDATKGKKGGKAAKSDPEKPEPKPRAVQIDGFDWSDDGSWAVFQAYSADNKERWIVGVDAAAGKMVPLERITDPAWINWAFRDIGWMPAARTLWYLTEESGYSQLYLRPVDGRRRQLTRGSFEIRGASDGSGPAVARDGKSFVVVANREHPGIWEAYRVSADSGELTRLTSAGGENDVFVSPDERSLLITHGRATRPPELYLQAASAGAAARQLTESRSPEFAAITWAEPRYVTIPPKHGQAPIHARLYLPAPAVSPPGTPQPAVQFIHGAGYLQNADQGWSGYFREFMFHSLLTRHGYVVLDMDFRASAGYGRDWRTAIYRVMGTPELEDMRDGVDMLVAEHGVDRARVGVYGGSYGGFLTVMALFREPDLFAAGAALRTVTDWAHYNHPYTSNILNTPEIDPEAYAIASPIEYAAGLQKPLLLCHGMVDDNVVFQDTVRLVQRLIELKKENFETAIYPVEPHGFIEPTSWLDEYRRIFKLFDRYVGGSAQACSG